jgi:hypothetical protein
VAERRPYLPLLAASRRKHLNTSPASVGGQRVWRAAGCRPWPPLSPAPARGPGHATWRQSAVPSRRYFPLTLRRAQTRARGKSCFCAAAVWNGHMGIERIARVGARLLDPGDRLTASSRSQETWGRAGQGSARSAASGASRRYISASDSRASCSVMTRGGAMRSTFFASGPRRWMPSPPLPSPK